MKKVATIGAKAPDETRTEELPNTKNVTFFHYANRKTAASKVKIQELLKMICLYLTANKIYTMP